MGNYETIINKKIEAFSKDRWPRVVWRLQRLPWNKPIEEIYYDWCTVWGFADRLKDLLERHDENEHIDGVHFSTVKDNYTSIMAYLWLARGERDPGQAWNLVNSADKLLPLVIDSDAFGRSVIRMRAWDGALFKLFEGLRERLEELDGICRHSGRSAAWDEKVPEDLADILDRMIARRKSAVQTGGVMDVWLTNVPDEVYGIIRKMIEDINALFRNTTSKKVREFKTYGALEGVGEVAKERLDKYVTDLPKSDPKVEVNITALKDGINDSFRCIKVWYKQSNQPPSAGNTTPHNVISAPGRMTKTNRRVEYCKQANRAQLWYSVNARLTLRYALWRHYFEMLLIFSVIAIAALEFALAEIEPDNPWWFRPFLGIWILGLFGASLSTEVIKRETVHKSTSVQLIRMLASVRILTGGAGAVVVLLLIGSGMLATSLGDLVMSDIWVFGTVGVIAGFSEQFWVSSLNSAADNLTLVGGSK